MLPRIPRLPAPLGAEAGIEPELQDMHDLVASPIP